MSDNLLQIENLSFSLGRRRIFTELSFSVPPGSIVGILGPNGSGKTTLLRLLCRYWKSDVGEFYLQGKNFTSHSPVLFHRLVSYLPQNLPDHLPMTVEEFLLLGLYPNLVKHHVVKAETDHLDWLIERFDLVPIRLQRVGNLSSGEMRRVFLAAGLMNRPILYLLDEPNAGLDWKHHEMIFEQLKNYQQQAGLTLVLSLHDIGLARIFCDRILLLSPRSETRFGRTEEILHQEILEETYGVKFPLHYTGSWLR